MFSTRTKILYRDSETFSILSPKWTHRFGKFRSKKRCASKRLDSVCDSFSRYTNPQNLARFSCHTNYYLIEAVIYSFRVGTSLHDELREGLKCTSLKRYLTSQILENFGVWLKNGVICIFLFLELIGNIRHLEVCVDKQYVYSSTCI